MMIDLLIYLIITITSIFIGLFLGRNFTRLKFEKKQATLEERNTILSNGFHKITEDLKNSQLEKEALIATKTRLDIELKNSELLPLYPYFGRLLYISPLPPLPTLIL